MGSGLVGFDVETLPGGSTGHIVIYEGPVKFDFMYLKESNLKPDPKWVGCAVLKGASDHVGDVIARSKGLAPPQPCPEALLDLNQRFWIWCWYVFGKIVRGELWEALDGLHTIRSLALLCPCWTGSPRDPTEATGGWSVSRTQRRHHV